MNYYFNTSKMSSKEISDNVVKVIDEKGNPFGTAFFLSLSDKVFCITCHHVLYGLNKIFVARNNTVLPLDWAEKYSNPYKDVAVFIVNESPFKPLEFKDETFKDIPKPILDILGPLSATVFAFDDVVNVNIYPKYSNYHLLAQRAKGSQLSNGNRDAKLKVFKIQGQFKPQFNGAPVCHNLDSKVIGMFLFKETNYSYIIPVDTVLQKIRYRDQTYSSLLNPSDSIVEKGNKFLAQGNYNEALIVYEKLLSQNENTDDHNYMRALNNKAVALANMGEYEKALECYDRALKIDPNFEIGWYHKGITLEKIGRYEKALVCYDRALKLNSYEPSIWCSKAEVLSKQKKYEEAIGCYKRARRIEPRNKKTLFNIAVAMISLGKYDKALAYLNKALEIDSNYIDALMNKGVVLKRLGLLYASMECYDLIIRIAPDRSDAWNNKGIVFAQVGEYEKALECYDRALKIDPNYAKAWYNKGVDLARLGRMQESEDCIVKARQLGHD